MKWRIRKLEWKDEKREREKRKLNIIINGEKLEEMDSEEKVERFLKINMKVEVKIEKAQEIKGKRGNKMIITKVKKLGNEGTNND